MKDRVACLVALTLVFAGRAAFAVDDLIPGTRVVVTPSVVTFTAKDGPSYTIPAGGGPGDPTLVGGSIRVWDVGNPANQEIYSLPAGGWQALGSSGYRYHGTGAPADPCRNVRVQSTLIDFDCDGPTTTLSLPLSGDAGVTVTLGANVQRYCAILGGLLASNTGDLYKRLDSLPPPLCEPTPVPFEEELAGRVAVVKSQRMARFVSRPGVSLLPDSAGDAPVVDGATIRIFDTGSGAGDISYPLPAARWKSARLGYKYRGPISDPCPTVLLTPKSVKAICRREAVDLTPPFIGDAAFVITSGASARYCVQFGGEEVRNDAVLFKRKNADAPVTCPSPSGAFLEVGADLFE